MINFFIIAIGVGQMWQPLHIQANMLTTSLQDQTTATSSLEGQPRNQTSSNEQKLGTTSTQKLTFGISLLQGPATGTPPLQKPTTGTPPVPELTSGTPPLQKQPMRTTHLQKQTGTPPLQEQPKWTTSLQKLASRKPPFRGDTRRSTITSSATVESNLDLTSSFLLVPVLSEKTKGNEKMEGSQTPQSQNEPTDKANRIAKIFAYLLGSILIIMALTTIVIWKCVAKRVPVDTNWAGRSPLADGEISPDLPIPTEEDIQCTQRPSITSNNLFPGMFSKKQFLLDDDSVKVNTSKDKLCKIKNQDGQNEVGQSNPTLDIQNASATMSPILTDSGEFKTMPKLTDFLNSEHHSVVSTKLVNEPSLPEPSEMPSLELPSPRPLNDVYENTEALANRFDSFAIDQSQQESQLFPPPPLCILKDET